jgi:threonine aldolase
MAIDLRSDTVTRPSLAMREAIASAPVGDDVYSDDPTVNSLEERVAAMFGKEAGVFTPTGSLANQLAIRMLVAPGEELIAETNSHIVRAELGAAAVFSGITTRTFPAKNGLLKAADALEIARPNSGPYLVSTTAIAVENTHNFGGGTVQPISEIAALRKGADELGVALAFRWCTHLERTCCIRCWICRVRKVLRHNLCVFIKRFRRTSWIHHAFNQGTGC